MRGVCFVVRPIYSGPCHHIIHTLHLPYLFLQFDRSRAVVAEVVPFVMYPPIDDVVLRIMMNLVLGCEYRIEEAIKERSRNIDT